MAVNETLIYEWMDDYGGADTNLPQGSDNIGTNADDYLRAIKHVVRAESVNKQWERWRGKYGTLSRLAANQFRLSGDQTAICLVGRRVKIVHSGNADAFGQITAASFGGGNTDVTVLCDVNQIETDLTEVMFGAVTNQNGAIPPAPRYAKADLPTPQVRGRIAIVSDDADRPWYDNGTAWQRLVPLQTTVTISDTDTEAEVTFASLNAPDEDDTDYKVTLGVELVGSTLGINAFVKAGKTTSSFFIILSAAPGVGNSIKVNVSIGR